MGREFVDIFDEWVHTYDDSVSGQDKEYKDVFYKYDEILQAVADAAKGPVVEFGVGTGNLTEKLLAKGFGVLGIEPNEAMRNVTREKLKGTAIIDGDFLEFELPIKAHSFVSSYAFHHLTDTEKAQAFKRYAELLPTGGRVVFADTMFESEAARKNVIDFEKSRGHDNLVEDLNREYYTTLPVMKELIEQAGFAVEFTQLNKYVWLINAFKTTEATDWPVH